MGRSGTGGTERLGWRQPEQYRTFTPSAANPDRQGYCSSCLDLPRCVFKTTCLYATESLIMKDGNMINYNKALKVRTLPKPEKKKTVRELS